MAMEGIFKRYIVSPKRGVYRDKEKNGSECLFCILVKNIPEKLPSAASAGGDTFYIIKNYRAHVLIVNPFPYSPRGHLEVVSKRHIERFQDLEMEEFSELQEIINESINSLSRAYHVSDFNVGINLGKLAGASQNHFHVHIIPRFESETGFMEAASSTRVIGEDPEQTMRKVAENIK